jgi:signal transduction histidine kinase
MENERILQRLLGEDILFATNLHPSLWQVRADAGQMYQVLMNLLVNARDAMPRGGEMTISTANIEIRPEAETGSVPAGAYVSLEVSDTGVGMTGEVQTHLFEPFFTTKEKGKGTGLGLSTVYGIVRQSGGHINVKSAPGEGATFTVLLPKAS